MWPVRREEDPRLDDVLFRRLRLSEPIETADHQQVFAFADDLAGAPPPERYVERSHGGPARVQTEAEEIADLGHARSVVRWPSWWFGDLCWSRCAVRWSRRPPQIQRLS